MGRTSKRTYIFDRVKDKTGGKSPGKQQGARYYKAGIYARLSSGQDLKKMNPYRRRLKLRRIDILKHGTRAIKIKWQSLTAILMCRTQN